jgi:hypothetical protein
LTDSVSSEYDTFEIDLCGVGRPDAEDAWLEALHPPNKTAPAFHDSRRSLTKE